MAEKIQTGYNSQLVDIKALAVFVEDFGWNDVTFRVLSLLMYEELLAACGILVAGFEGSKGAGPNPF